MHSIRFALSSRWIKTSLFFIFLLLTRPLLGVENEMANEVVQDWKKLTGTLNQCSGTAAFSSKITPPGARKPKDLSMDFATRGKLQKRMATDDKEETHYLWNSHGTFIVRKPKGEASWSLAKIEPPLEPEGRDAHLPRNFLLGGVCILGVPILDLLNSGDYEITSCERAENGEVRVDIKYLIGMENFNFGDRLSRNRTPFFDTLEVYVDSEHQSRIMRYRLVRLASENKKGWVRGSYTYSESLPLIPAETAVEWGREGRETASSSDSCQFQVSMDAPPAKEFELEHYGIKTPNMYVAQFPWYGYLFIVIALVSLGLITRKVITNRREAHS